MTSNVDKALREAIEKRYKEVDSKISSKDFAGLMKCWAPNGKLMPPTGETIIGAEEIKKFVEKMYAEVGECASKIEEVTGDGDWAYSRGTYKFSQGGKEVESGKFVTVWKKINGEYHVYTDVWNVSKKA